MKPPTTRTVEYDSERPPVIIERRQVVAELHYADDGEPMLRAAMIAVADALAESLSASNPNDRLEFTMPSHGGYPGHTFTISADPLTSP